MNPANGPPPHGPQAVQNSDTRNLEESLANVREALAGLKFGNVVLTIHEGRVVQIDVTEKKRISPS